MNKYVFLTNQYVPKPGATGQCIHQLAKHLAKSGNDVTTICYDDESNINKYDGVNIIRIKPPFYMNENITSKFKKSIASFASRLSKTIYIFKYPLRSVLLVKKYYNNCRKIINKNDYVTIIASYTPLEAVLAAYHIKIKYKTKVKIVYYSADTLSNDMDISGILPLKYRKKQGIRWEKRLFKLYDRILIMECHKEHYLSDTYSNFHNKMSIVNFPLLENTANQNKKQENKNKKIKMVYAGSFYKKIRNPEYLLKTLTTIIKNKKISVDIMGTGDCTDTIENYANKSNGLIKYHGMIEHDKVVKYMDDCDVLLSVGNKNSPMVPSKIYEYMATGKPIIHIYYDESDSCIKPLEKYENSLLIRDGDINAEKKILPFLSKLTTLPYKVVKEKFLTSTPEYTINEILKK